MPHPLSNDLRERVVAFIEAGHSRHEAAAHFDTSVSFAVNLMKLWQETGSVEPRPRGGFRHDNASAEKPLPSCTSPQSGSCSGSYAIQHELFGQTLSLLYKQIFCNRLH